MRVDYKKIAQTYDKGRSYSENKLAFWLDILKKYGNLHSHSMVLDVGCGTGRYAIPLSERCSCSVVGIDVSKEMLEEGKKKFESNRVKWVRADAENLPFSEGIFDFCLMSMVIHHICRKQKAIGEMYRVLASNGRFLIRTCSHEQLKDLPDYYFFPQALEIDMARIPDVPILQTMLSAAGFAQVYVHEITSPALESTEEYLVKLRSKHTSTLYLLSEQDFNRGLRKAEKYFSKRSLPKVWKTESISAIVATKNVL